MEPVTEPVLNHATPIPEQAEPDIVSPSHKNRKILMGVLFALILVLIGGVAIRAMNGTSSNTTPTPTPSVTTIPSPLPTATPLVTYPSPTHQLGIDPVPSVEPTNFYTQQIKCTTNADCAAARPCDQKTLDMYGNASHCPIAQCTNGTCNWLLVPGSK